MQSGQPNLLATLLPILIVAFVFILRMRRMTTERLLKVQYLWARPVIYLVLATVLIVSLPPAISDLPWLALVAVLGAAGGWQWGRTMAIHVHPENGTLMMKGSAVGMMVLVLLILVRVGLRTALPMEAGAWHLSPGFVTLVLDALIVFAAAMFAVRSLEMFLRARRVMAEAR